MKATPCLFLCICRPITQINVNDEKGFALLKRGRYIGAWYYFRRQRYIGGRESYRAPETEKADKSDLQINKKMFVADLLITLPSSTIDHQSICVPREQRRQ